MYILCIYVYRYRLGCLPHNSEGYKHPHTRGFSSKFLRLTGFVALFKPLLCCTVARPLHRLNTSP